MNGYSRFPIDTYDECKRCGGYAVEKYSTTDSGVRFCLACFHPHWSDDV